MRRMVTGSVLLGALAAVWFLVPAGRAGLARSTRGMKALAMEIRKAEVPQVAMQSDTGDTDAGLIPKLPSFKGADISIEGDPAMGNQDAKVTMVEFTDYQCPFCGSAFRHTYQPLVEEYVKTGKVKYVIHDFPLQQIHSRAFKAAEAARCAGDQGKYWEMHDRLFENQKELDPNGLVTSAQALGLDTDQFQQCLDTGKYKAEIASEIQAGIKLGVFATPTFFIGPTGADPDQFRATKQIAGAYPYATFKKAIEDILSAPSEDP